MFGFCPLLRSFSSPPPHPFSPSFPLFSSLSYVILFFGQVPYAVYMILGLDFTGFHVRFRDISRGGVRVIKSTPETYKINRRTQFLENYNLAYVIPLHMALCHACHHAINYKWFALLVAFSNFVVPLFLCSVASLLFPSKQGTRKSSRIKISQKVGARAPS